MIVCIAEKPSVARDIAAVLGAGQRHEGYLEGNGYQVTWTFGHLCRLLEPQEYSDFWKPWALSRLPMIPERFSIKVADDAGVQKQFNIIRSLVEKAELVINCGDAGQEGELIQRWVLQKAHCQCPVQRLWISSLTPEAIKEGFGHLHPAEDYRPLYEAGLMRAIGDWLLGMNATRAYTLRYGKDRQVLSIGRVQTPTLALIVRRQEEIDNFKPEPYWELKTTYRDTVFSAAKGRFDKEDEALARLEEIRQTPFVVTSVEKKKGKEFAPRLFDLTSLQVECNRKFSYSAEETLQIIQSLYEKKATTYPRVDTTYLSDDIYPKVPGILQGIRDSYPEIIAPLLEGKKLPRSKKVFDNSKVTDHHAIIPTGMKAVGLNDREMKVYDLVTRRFIAAFWPDCQIATTTVQGQAAEVPFKASGKQILEPGWRTVFEKKDPGAPSRDEGENGENAGAEEERTLPDFARGESGPHQPEISAKTTLPPKPYTEATLLRAMETAGKTVEDESLREALKENGIGRPSTRAAIIETLFKRHYVVKERKNLIPTDTGIELIHTINDELLKSASLTGRWEKKLREIEHGRYQAADFLCELKDMVSRLMISVKSDKSGDLCPLCQQGRIIRGRTAYGCSRWREGCTWREPFAQNTEDTQENTDK
ncbi:MAG: DNA topoisomerase 3 [Bacteroidales bacterium]|nr:DNA topoisomerase 3 [Bacteroidales bacterium]